MEFPPYANLIIERLTAAGFSAYAVGGCVRDSLLGRTPADWDITTSARPKETIEIFSSAPFSIRADNGLKHGTVTVILDGSTCEVTTFRTEGTYTDHRRPDTVTFVSDISDDLSRRDFTVNAMAAAPAPGGGYVLIDPFGGKSDLNAGILRCVGEPEKRFSEDALRILRGMRFAARYDFRIDPATARAMHDCAPLLDAIAPERIGDEMRGILKAPHCGKILTDFADIAERLLPGCTADLAETLFVRADSPELRLLCLLSDCPPETAKKHLLRYGFGKAAAETTASYLRLKKADLRQKEVLCRIADVCGKDGTNTYFTFRRILCPADSSLGEAQSAVRDLFRPGACYNTATLSISGKDLLAAGAAEGPYLGKILTALTARVIAGDLPNDPAALLKAARDMQI